jgi:hypothetical protein
MNFRDFFMSSPPAVYCPKTDKMLLPIRPEGNLSPISPNIQRIRDENLFINYLSYQSKSVRKQMFSRIVLIISILIALSGCGLLSGGDKIRRPYLGAAAVTAPIPAVRILVSRDARDKSAQVVESIALIAPDGTRYTPRADRQEISRQPYSYATRIELRGSGGSSRIPDNLGVSPPAQRRSEFINITALIDIPNLENYRRLSDQWTVAVVFSGANGKKEKITIPAPPLE